MTSVAPLVHIHHVKGDPLVSSRSSASRPTTETATRLPPPPRPNLLFAHFSSVDIGPSLLSTLWPRHSIFIMFFGFRASYHQTQITSASMVSREPICPCSRCFDGTGAGHETLKFHRSPAPRGFKRSHSQHGSVSRSEGLGMFGFARLRRWRGVDSAASDVRLLKDDEEGGCAESVEGQSLLEEQLKDTE